jgi:hypothetical protein
VFPPLLHTCRASIIYKRSAIDKDEDGCGISFRLPFNATVSLSFLQFCRKLGVAGANSLHASDVSPSFIGSSRFAEIVVVDQEDGGSQVVHEAHLHCRRMVFFIFRSAVLVLFEFTIVLPQAQFLMLCQQMASNHIHFILRPPPPSNSPSFCIPPPPFILPSSTPPLPSCALNIDLLSCPLPLVPPPSSFCSCLNLAARSSPAVLIDSFTFSHKLETDLLRVSHH